MNKAAVFQGFDAPLLVQDLAMPEPAPDGVVLRVTHCGICGSDLHMAHDPAFGAQPGDVFGHEFAGEVVALGRDCTQLQVGDQVSVIPLGGCGQCQTCRAGEPAWCSEMSLQGGGYGQFTTTTERQCRKLPAGVTAEEGALAEPLAVALHGVALSGLTAGDRVLILGAGPIGLATAFWARRLGATAAVVQDIHPEARDLALAMGATDFLCTPDSPVQASDAALGRKADIVFDCAGAPPLLAQAIDQVRVKGRIVILALSTRETSFIPFAAVSKEVAVLTSAFFTLREYEAALDALASGAPVAEALVTRTISLDQLPEVFEGMKTGRSHGKVIVRP